MPIPTTSPAWTLAESQGSNVSSVISGSPYESGVAAARTYNHRGVITPTPNDRPLGLMRCTVIQSPVSNRYAAFRAGPYCPTDKEHKGLKTRTLPPRFLARPAARGFLLGFGAAAAARIHVRDH